MIWNHKGHELDQYAERMTGLNPQIKYYIFGAGILGKELMIVLRKYGCLVAFIDNSIEKQQNKIDDFEVISFQEYLKRRDGQIVIAATKKNSRIIRKQMEENLLHHEIDFFEYDEFSERVFPVISLYCFHKLYIALTQITLTERCTLKCKKCAHGCFAVDYSTASDLTLEQVFKSADYFFSKVDFIKEFVLIGGEPLLYKELPQAIQYIGEEYREKIGTYTITTNGTIVPDEEVLKLCKKYNVLFRISNYSHQIPRLKEAYQRLTDTLNEHGIAFLLGEEDFEWMDYGFEYVKRESDEDVLIKVFDACKTPCREIRENKFYFCVMARSVSDNLKLHVGEQDYLDFLKLDVTEYKKEVLEYSLGYSDKGYLDMCRFCNGAEANDKPIPAAEQVERI